MRPPAMREQEITGTLAPLASPSLSAMARLVPPAPPLHRTFPFTPRPSMASMSSASVPTVE